MNCAESRMHFKIDWLDSFEGVECKTLASIALVFDGTPVWPVKGEDTHEFEWYVDELLAHLTECWKPLVLRQTYPISVQPDRPSFLPIEATKRWSTLPQSIVEAEAEQVAAFEDVHNLANAFGGISGLVPLWFLRDQDQMIVDTQELWMRVPFGEAIAALVAAGDVIAARLQEADKEKWDKLTKAWMRRDEGEPTLLLALTIGRDKETAATLLAEKVLEAPKSVGEAANDNDELRIAARMAGPLPLHQVKAVIEKVKACDLRNAPRLQEVAESARTFIESTELRDEKPYFQGSELAIWLRRTLELSANQPVDPVHVLERRFNVDVRALDFAIPSLDAIVVWGPKHGPGVLLNRTSNRIHLPSKEGSIWRSGALRVTAAHELCHLLLDSKHTLTAVEVLDGRMPARIEQRAKSFAAEFLLPSKEAGEVWRNKGYPLDSETLRSVIKALCRKYKVTGSVAAWQIQHGAPATSWDELDPVLDQVVPHR